MDEPSSFRGTAFNQATESENRIHSDEVARRYGFRGGLVPGVTVYAYLVHPALKAWGARWLEEGAHLYVCGSTAMGQAVQHTLLEIAGAHGDLATDAAEAYIDELRRDGRYQRDTY